MKYENAVHCYDTKKEREKNVILILFPKGPNICSKLFNCCSEEHPSVERPPLWADGFYIKVI